MSNDMVLVELDRKQLRALQDVLQQASDFAERESAKAEKTGDYYPYDSGMSDWREDIHFSVENLLGTLTELGDGNDLSVKDNVTGEWVY